MQRRRFLAWTGLSFGLAATAPRLMGAPSPRGDVHPHGADLTAELERARDLGKPLLVLIDPARVDPSPPTDGDAWNRITGGAFEGDPEERTEAFKARWERQPTLGAWLLHGDDEQLARLALCHVTTARVRDLEDQLDVDLGRGEAPWFVLVESGPGEPVAQPARGSLPPLQNRWKEARDPDESHEDRWDRIAALEEADMRARLALLDTWLAERLAEREPRARAQQVAASLGQAEARALQEAQASGAAFSDRLLYRLGALALWRARADEEQHAAVVAAQARQARSDFEAAPPRGAHWGDSAGCGGHVECDTDPRAYASMVGCGMGRTPALSRDFLAFFVRHV